MFELFESKDPYSSGVVTYSEFDYLKVTYSRELLNIEDYYHNRVYAVRSNHLLCRLLLTMDVPLAYSPESYVTTASARAPYVAKALGLTSELGEGRIFDGVFYGKGCPEVILSTAKYFNPNAIEDWRKIRAVNVLTHPRSDLGLLLPNGKTSGSETGLAVIDVDLPLLMYQYRCFVKDQVARAAEKHGYLGVSHFIHIYVLPNMMQSHMDFLVLNRAMNLYYDRPMGVATMRHAFDVLDYGARVDKVLAGYMADMENSRLRLTMMLKNMPSLISQDAESALILPEIPPNKQVFWTKILSRMAYVKFFLDLGRNHVKATSMQEINNLKLTLRRVKNQGILEMVLPPELLTKSQAMIQELLEF